MYKVIVSFTDLQDNGFAYNRGDTYPRDGIEPTESRIKELSTSANRLGVALIEEVRETKNAVSTETEKAESVSVEDEPKKQRGKKRKD